MQADAFGGLGALPTVMLLDEHLGYQYRPELFDHDIMCVLLGNGRGLGIFIGRLAAAVRCRGWLCWMEKPDLSPC